jgi:hypothetical protein
MIIAEHFDWNTFVNSAGKSYMSSDRQHPPASMQLTYHHRFDEGNLLGRLAVAMQTCAARNRE